MIRYQEKCKILCHHNSSNHKLKSRSNSRSRSRSRDKEKERNKRIKISSSKSKEKVSHRLKTESYRDRNDYKIPREIYNRNHKVDKYHKNEKISDKSIKQDEREKKGELSNEKNKEKIEHGENKTLEKKQNIINKENKFSSKEKDIEIPEHTKKQEEFKIKSVNFVENNLKYL